MQQPVGFKKIVAVSKNNVKTITNKVTPLDRLLEKYTENGNHLPSEDRLVAYISLVLMNSGVEKMDAYDFVYHLVNSSFAVK